MVGQAIWDKYKRWPVYSKFFDNMGPIPHHLHQSEEQAQLVGREGKPEGYYFPPQLNATYGNFPHTYFGLEPGTTKDRYSRCLARWDKGDNGILDYSKAYRLKPGTGWLVPPRILHAPGSLLTYEPQWGSDVLSMFQSMVDGRRVEREPADSGCSRRQARRSRLPGRSCRLGPAIPMPISRSKHYIEPIAAAGIGRGTATSTGGSSTARLPAQQKFQRERTDRAAGRALHDPRPRRLRPDRDPGPRPTGQTGCRLPVADPLRTDDPGRSIHVA